MGAFSCDGLLSQSILASEIKITIPVLGCSSNIRNNVQMLSRDQTRLIFSEQTILRCSISDTAKLPASRKQYIQIISTKVCL